MAGPSNQDPPQEEVYSPAEAVKEAREASLRAQAVMQQLSHQMERHSKEQQETMSKQSEQIALLHAQLQAKSAPKKSDKMSNPEVKKHMEPLEKAQHAISQAKSAFEGHLDGSSPLASLSESEIAALKNQCDEGELASNRSPSPMPLPPPVLAPTPRPPSSSMQTSGRGLNTQCWSCGQFGHIAPNCPNTASIAANAGKRYY